MTAHKPVAQKPSAWLQIGLGDNEGQIIARTSLPKRWDKSWWRFEPLYTHQAQQERKPAGKFQLGDMVRKIKGSQWTGRIVGSYSTDLTPVGWAVESSTELGSVQIYPEAALEIVEAQQECKPHTEAEVQELLRLAGFYQSQDDEEVVRRILGVPAP